MHKNNLNGTTAYQAYYSMERAPVKILIAENLKHSVLMTTEIYV